MDYVSVNPNHLKSSIKREGKTMRHFNEKLGRNRSFLSNVMTGSERITRNELQMIADELNTTMEYLLGETTDHRTPAQASAEDDLLNTLIKKSSSASSCAQNSKFNDLYQQIAKKETAEADLAELERFMKYLAERGE